MEKLPLTENGVVLVALQGVVVEVLKELIKVDPKLALAIKTGFDNAADQAEKVSMQRPKDYVGLSSTRILEVVEEIRGFTLGGIAK